MCICDLLLCIDPLRMASSRRVNYTPSRIYGTVFTDVWGTDEQIRSFRKHGLCVGTVGTVLGADGFAVGIVGISK